MLTTEDFYVTSDLHLGHRFVSKLRGFESTEDHDKVIIDNLMALPDGATIIILGDISVRKDLDALNTLEEIKKIKGFTLVLTPGNHDKVHPMDSSSEEWEPLYAEVFDQVSTMIYAAINRRKLVFTHYPVWGSIAMNPEFETERTKQWWAPDLHATTVVHGHTHSAEPVARGHVNVALEAHDMKPIHVSELMKFVDQAN